MNGFELLKLFVTLEVTGRADVSRELREVEAEGQRAEDRLGSIGDTSGRSAKKVEGAGSRIVKTLVGVRKEAKRTDGADATVEVRERGSKGVLSTFARVVSGARDVGKSEATVTVGERGSKGVIGTLSRVVAGVNDVNGKDATVRVGETGAASVVSSLLGVNKAADSVDGRDATVGVAERGAAGTVAALVGVGKAADSLEGRDIDMAVDVDTGGAVAQLGAFRAAAIGLTGSLSAMDNGLSAGGVRITAFAGAAVAAAALLSPLLGALASVGSLAAAAGAGIGLIAAPVALVVNRLTEYHESLDKVASKEKALASASDSAASAQDGVRSATDGLRTAREGLENATDQLEDAQTQLNYAMQDEPTNQEQATLDLEQARLRVTETTERYNEAVKEYGANSTEARAAALDLRQAELDLSQQTRDTNRIRRDGSDQLQSAMAAEKAAQEGVANAARGVEAAQRQVAQAQAAAAQAAEAQAQAQAELKEETKTLPPALMALYNTAMRFGEAASRAFGGAQNAVARLGTTILRDVRPALGALASASERTIGALSFAWESLVSQMRLPAQQRSVGQILGITPEIVRSLTTSVANFSMALINVFAAAAPSAARLAQFIERISISLLSWSRSTAGANAVRAAIASAVPVFRALWDMVTRVGAALFRFGTDNAGAIAQAIRIVTTVLVGLINGFSAVTRVIGPVNIVLALLAPLLLGAAMVVGQMITGFVGLATAAGGVLMALRFVGTFLMGPWGIALAAVAAGVVLLVRHFGGLRATFDKVKGVLGPLVPIFNRVKDTIKNLGTVIKGLFTGNTGTEQFRKAFASLPGPVQEAVKRIVVAWRSLKNGFQQGWNQIKPILTAVGNGIKKALGAALKFLVDQAKAALNAFRKNWPAIKQAVLPVLSAIAKGIKNVLGAAFKFALNQAQYVVNWFQKNWPLIKRTAETVFNAVKRAVVSNLQFVWNRVVKPIVTALVNFWRKNHTEITNILQAAWRIVKTVVSTSIKAVLGIIKAVMQAITGDWKGAWETIKKVLSTVWEGIKKVIRLAIEVAKNLIKVGWEAVKSLTSAAWNAIKKLTSAAWEAIKDYIGDKLDAAKKRAGEIVQSLKETLGDAWEAIKRGAGDAWEAIKKAMQDPISAAAEFISNRIQDIVGVVNAVLKAFGQKTISLGGSGAGGGNPGGTMNDDSIAPGQMGRARGGVYGRKHAQTRLMARGGVVPQDAVGGIADGRLPHAVYGEVGSPEAYVVKDRPTREQFPYLREAARWHGFGLFPNRPQRSYRRDPERLAPRFARGGILEAWRRMGVPMHALGRMDNTGAGAGQYGPTNNSLWDAATRERANRIIANHRVSVNTYENHPPGYPGYAGSSIDSWAYAGRGTPIGYPQPHDAVLGFIRSALAHGLKWTLGEGDAGHSGGYRHVHATWEPGGKASTGAIGGSGTIGPSLAEQIWAGAGAAPQGWAGGALRGAVQGFLQGLGPAGQLLSGLASNFPGLKGLLPIRGSERGSLGNFGDGVIASAIENYVGEKYKGWIKDWIYANFGTTGTSGGGMPGGDSPTGLSIIEAVRQGGWAESLARTAAGVIWEESSGNARAQNPSGARGLMQIMPATARGIGVDYSRLYDPIYNTAAGKKVYDSQGWGAWVAYPPSSASMAHADDRVTGYARGGVANSKGPALQMPRSVAAAFKTVADALNRLVGGRENGMLRMPQGGVATGERLVGIAAEDGMEAIVPKRRTPEGASALRAANRWYGVPGYAAGGVANYQGWDLVGTDAVLGYRNRSQWGNLIQQAAGIWTKGSGIPMRPGRGVTIFDKALAGATAGITGSGGTMALDSYITDPMLMLSVLLHEIGHAFGLKHGPGIMSAGVRRGMRPSAQNFRDVHNIHQGNMEPRKMRAPHGGGGGKNTPYHGTGPGTGSGTSLPLGNLFGGDWGQTIGNLISGSGGPSSASQNIHPGSLGGISTGSGGNTHFVFRQHNAVGGFSTRSAPHRTGGTKQRIAAPVDGVRTRAALDLEAAVRSDRLEAGVENLRREVAHQTNVVGALLESIPPETGREVRGGMIDGLKGGDADLQRAARYAVEDRGGYTRMAQ